MSGLEVQAKLARKYPAIPVAFITGFGQIATAVKALQQGAVDFIEKPFDEKKLIELVNKMLNQAFAKIKEVDELKAVVDNFKKLTPREKQVLDCIVGGKINKAIAEFLGISIKTVEAHRASVMEKLGVSRPAVNGSHALPLNTLMRQSLLMKQKARWVCCRRLPTHQRTF